MSLVSPFPTRPGLHGIFRRVGVKFVNFGSTGR